MHAAASNGYPEVIRLLLQQGIDVSAVNIDGATLCTRRAQTVTLRAWSCCWISAQIHQLLGTTDKFRQHRCREEIATV